MPPSEMPSEKKMKYSGPTKENSNRLIEKILEMIKNDRHYAKKAPLWTSQVLNNRNAIFLILIYLIRVVV